MDVCVKSRQINVKRKWGAKGYIHLLTISPATKLKDLEKIIYHTRGRKKENQQHDCKNKFCASRQFNERKERFAKHDSVKHVRRSATVVLMGTQCVARESFLEIRNMEI